MSNKVPGQISACEIEELELHKTLDSLQKEYQKYAKEVPEVSVDRQILAAAQREILAPNKKAPLKNSLWRKFSLPLYATATFAFTALVIHVLLPSPVRVPPGTSAGPITIDVINEDTSGSVKEPRNKLQVPEIEPFQSLPKFPTTEIDNYKSGLLNIELDGSESSQSELFNGSLSAGKIVPNDLPDKEIWAREIISLFKSGDHLKSQAELKKFKKIFPDFPIDEQIASFKQ